MKFTSSGVNQKLDKVVDMVGGYRVITLCGSTRFKDQFMEAQKQLTLDGNIVISVGLFGHSGDNEVWEGMDEDTLTKTKLMLDDMHKRKIDMSDGIYVINVGGYIGDSTRSEIEYTKRTGKDIQYLEEPVSEDELPDDAIDVSEILMSTRLWTILFRSRINDLRQVEDIAEEEMLKIRNMGAGTKDELIKICEQYGVHVYSRKDLEDESIGVSFTQNQYEQIFRAGIRSKEDVHQLNESQIVEIFGAKSAIGIKLLKVKHCLRNKSNENKTIL